MKPLRSTAGIHIEEERERVDIPQLADISEAAIRSVRLGSDTHSCCNFSNSDRVFGNLYLFLSDVTMHSLSNISCVNDIVIGVLVVALLHEIYNS